jgi:pyridoxine 4-dehydrogenase
MAHNLKLVEQVQGIASNKGCTAAQLAIAWVRSVSKKDGMPLVIPIPGSTTVDRVTENSKVVELSQEDLQEIDKVLADFEIKGRRYPAGIPTEL